MGSSLVQCRPGPGQTSLDFGLGMQRRKFERNSPFLNEKKWICKCLMYLLVGLLADTALSTSTGEQAGSVFVKASWHSGGFLHVEAKAWSSAEVDIALSNSLWPVSKDSEDPGKQQINQQNWNRHWGFQSDGHILGMMGETLLRDPSNSINIQSGVSQAQTKWNGSFASTRGCFFSCRFFVYWLRMNKNKQENYSLCRNDLSK